MAVSDLALCNWTRKLRGISFDEPAEAVLSEFQLAMRGQCLPERCWFRGRLPVQEVIHFAARQGHALEPALLGFSRRLIV